MINKKEGTLIRTAGVSLKKKNTINGMLRTSFGSITIYDFEYRKVLFSQWNLMKSLGYGSDEFHEMSRDFFSKILHPEDQWIMDWLVHKISESKGEEVFNSTFRLKDVHGRYQRIAIRSSVIKRHWRGAPRELMVSLMNASRYQCIKRQRDKNIAMIENLSHRLSHELRAPVATVLGLVSILRKSAELHGSDPHRIIESLEITVNKMDNAIKEFGNTLHNDGKQMDTPVAVEQVIADNRHYSLKVNVDKNRIYLKIKGYWRNPDSVPQYITDWKKSLVQIKRNFTVLTDASEMKTHPREVRHLHEEVQKMIRNAGIKKVAEIVSDDIAEIQLNAMAKVTSFPKENFRNAEDAEAWLNKYSND